MKKNLDKWSREAGIVDELHRIREANEQLRQRVGDAAWLKKVNSASRRLGLDKRFKKAVASS